MLINQLFEAHGAAAGVETIKQLLHAVKDGKDIDLKVGPEMTPITYPEARYLLGFFKANRHLGDGVAKYFGDPNWIIGKLEKRDATMSPDRLNKFDIERMKDVQRDKVLDLEEIHVDHDDEKHNKKRMAEEATEYKGWRYDTDIEEYDDNRKIFHSAKKDGKEVSIDWSPYSYMSNEEFKTWVDLGMPTRKDVDSIGPLQPEDLEALMRTKLGTKARLAQEGEVTEEKCDCCGNEIVNGECGCGPECPHCGGKPHTKESEVNEGQLDEILPAIAGAAIRGLGGAALRGLGGAALRGAAGAALAGLGSDDKEMNEAEFEITYNAPQFSKPRTHTIKAVNAKSAEQKFLSFGNPYKILDIKKAEKVNEEQYSDFEVMRAIKVAQDYHDDMTHAIEKIDDIKPGLSNHRAVKDELRRQNEDKDDITKKLDPKTRIALKKQQMKTAGVTKGDPIAAMAMGLEKDVNRLDKENDEEEADIAAQELVDKYHTQELEQLKKMLDSILKK